MAISAAQGVGSGMDINGLVKSLVQADGQPAMNALNTKESATKSRLSALGKFKSALSDFQTAVTKLNTGAGAAFKSQIATSTNETLATVKAGLGAVSGNYSLEVVQLAKPQKSVSTASFTDLNAAVGEGTLTFAVGAKTPFSITVGPANNTLAGVRDAINAATTNNGVSASIINVDNGSGGTISKLVLAAKDPGSANSFTVSGTATGGAGAGLQQLFTPGLTQLNAAQDAIIKVDGQTATRSTNSLSDVIPGVTLDLKSVPAVATPFNVNIALDTKSITDAGTGFVDAYNKLQTVMKDLGKFDPVTKAAGPLAGDSTLRAVQSQVRQISSAVVASATTNVNSLATIGIGIDRNGVMSLDSTKFTGVMNTNLNALSQVFTATDGVATKLGTTLTTYLQPSGTFQGQTGTLNDRMKQITVSREKVQMRLDTLEKSLLKQFQAMDSIVGKFKSTGNFLAQKFG
ncbi:MAG: flagellar filament capping protein FliD [Methylococcaceae bacterium]|nr:flagellar filament capping protein FliD [Methylococcaceae bacterium]